MEIGGFAGRARVAACAGGCRRISSGGGMKYMWAFFTAGRACRVRVSG
jgi:hypothetical protein